MICLNGAAEGAPSNVGGAEKQTGNNAASTAESKKTCRLQQAQAVNGGKDVVFLFNVLRQKNGYVAIISTPLNVYLPSGLDVKIDKGKARRAVFETCNITGCHAGFVLEGALLASLRKGSTVTITIKDTKTTQIPIKVSLKGLNAGLQALDEQK